MKMRKFYQNKLWRDKAAILMEEMGSVIHRQELDDAQYSNELGLKLIEEATEVHMTQLPDELMTEIADVYEVLDSIIAFHKLSKQEILTIQEKKRAERGGFEKREFVTFAEHGQGSFGENYCLQDPERYPEVVSSNCCPKKK